METKRATWVLVLASLASFMVALDTLVVTVALTTIRADLNASIEQLEWTVNAYNLSFAVLLMTAAALGDRFGRRRMFAVGLGVFAVASAACALAPNAELLIAARAVQGVGAALVTTLALALVSANIPAEKRGAALGIFFAVTGLAVASGPLVGGAISEGLTWQWIFWINVPIGLALIPLALRKMPEGFGPDARVDIRGLVLVTVGAFGVVWGLVRGNIAGWESVEVLVALIGGVALIAAFVVWELRARAPMLPMKFFRARGFSAGNAASFFSVASLFGAVFFFAQFMQAGLGEGPLGAGLRLLPWTGTLFFIAPVAGALVDKLGERPFLIAGPILQAIGFGWTALIADSTMSYGELIAPMIVAGVGISMCFPAAQNSVVGSVPVEAVGKASGVNTTMRELGGVFGIAIGVAVFTGAGGYGSPAEFTDGFTATIATAAGLSLLAAVAGALLPSRQALAQSAQAQPTPTTRPAFEGESR